MHHFTILVVCNSACQNGGNCTEKNICECINGYTGNQYETHMFQTLICTFNMPMYPTIFS